MKTENKNLREEITIGQTNPYEPIDCDLFQDTFICSAETLSIMVESLTSNPKLKITSIRICDKGGYHIFVRLLK